MDTSNHPISRNPESSPTVKTNEIKTLTPEAMRAKLSQLAAFRFESQEGDPEGLVDRISYWNELLESLSETLLIPLLEADPDGITAIDYSFNELRTVRNHHDLLAEAREGWDEYDYKNILSRPALTHATNSSLVAALHDELGERLEQATKELSAARDRFGKNAKRVALLEASRDDLESDSRSVREDTQEESQVEDPATSMSCEFREDGDYGADEQHVFDSEDLLEYLVCMDDTISGLELNIVLDNGLGNIGWIDLTPGLGQTFEFVDSCERAVISAIKKVSEERAIIDQLRLSGVPSYITSIPLDQVTDELNKALRYQEMVEVAHQVADLFSDLSKNPKAQRHHVINAGCSKELFSCKYIRDKGGWDEVGSLTPKMVAKLATVVNGCLNVNPTTRLNDDTIKLAFTLPIDSWQVRADTNDDGTYSIVWWNATTTPDSTSTELVIEVSFDTPFSRRVRSVAVLRSTNAAPTSTTTSRVEVVEDCFETRALYQLLSYFSERAGKFQGNNAT